MSGNNHLLINGQFVNHDIICVTRDADNALLRRAVRVLWRIVYRFVFIPHRRRRPWSDVFSFSSSSLLFSLASSSLNLF